MQSLVVASFFSLRNAITIDSSRGPSARLIFFLGFEPSGAAGVAAAEPEGVGASSVALRLRLLAAGGLPALVPGLAPRLPLPPAVAFAGGTGLPARLPLASGLPARLLPAIAFCLGAFGLVALFATTALPRPGELAREVVRGCWRFLFLAFWGRGVCEPEAVRASVGVVAPLAVCGWD
jgi:hypothetical protein